MNRIDVRDTVELWQRYNMSPAQRRCIDGNEACLLGILFIHRGGSKLKFVSTTTAHEYLVSQGYGPEYLNGLFAGFDNASYGQHQSYEGFQDGRAVAQQMGL